MFGPQTFSFKFCQNWIWKRPALMALTSVTAVGTAIKTQKLQCESFVDKLTGLADEYNLKKDNSRKSMFLLGSGPRFVSFLGIYVYDIELYIRKQDLRTIQKVLNEQVDPNVGVEMSLKEAEVGSRIIEELLKRKIQYAVRILPARNTNFKHLKGGFTKAMLLRKDRNDENEERMIHGFRDTFPGTGTCLRSTTLSITLTDKDKLTYEHEGHEIGSMKDEGLKVSNLFLQSYLVGNKVNSEQARQSVCITLRRIMDGSLKV
ncbi:chalcone like protein family [Schizosaccharomyces cryophilus OY26]|uniref:Chalcone like protein family n=1 Tax=Schizosaccharomyces cryophilus (strain OY26 / ATCC MYA-4695 / CBS 11777 / NBRC 106824 / NRRL Y48691) TaxID=653667 RepID=S9XD74_SCHCR|nr:chalcone like protein family [Schizosaccharomyces cryophilus OY26]EPY51781.1 chalcone like protein family [Schizosaccharomyces cryophilus OY26]